MVLGEVETNVLDAGWSIDSRLENRSRCGGAYAFGNMLYESGKYWYSQDAPQGSAPTILGVGLVGFCGGPLG